MSATGRTTAGPRRARRWTRGLITAAATVALAVGAFAASSVHARARPARARAGALAASDAGEPAPSLFGINTGTYDRDVARLARDTPTAAALGATWVHFTGDSLTFNGDNVSFAGLDAAIDQ